MDIYYESFKKLAGSIISNDILILFAAFITFCAMIATSINARSIIKRRADWGKKRNSSFTRYLLKALSIKYTFFTTMITVFPLLGMLGTVCGLLGLDLKAGDIDNIKNNFFIALTSTAWGIIFSIVFKVLHAFIADGIEEQIEVAKELSKDLD